MSSDYLLLTAQTAHDPQDIRIPRPRLSTALLTAFAAVDLLTAGVFTILVVLQHLHGAVVLLVVHYARSLVVLSVGLSPRIRELGWLVAFSSLITLFVVLFDSNALVQRLPFNLEDRQKAKPSRTLVALLFCQLSFSILHWMAFVICIGVSKQRNPFGMGLNSNSRSYRYERSADVQEEDVVGDATAVLTVEEGSLLAVDQDDDSSEDDADDIVDIPPTTPGSYKSSYEGYGTIRSRASRASLRSPQKGPRARSSSQHLS